MNDEPISPLRQRMLDAMAVRNFSDKTRHDSIRHVKGFAAFLGRSPDTAGADDLRRFQLHQRQNGVQPSSMNSAVSALRFFFCVTLDRPDMERHLTFVREPRKIPVILSPEEIPPMIPIDAIKAISGNASEQTAEPQAERYPCPCCGGPMIIIERFERGCRPKHQPSPVPAAIRIDTS
jgi:site-specific recombinase XerD